MKGREERDERGMEERIGRGREREERKKEREERKKGREKRERESGVLVC